MFIESYTVVFTGRLSSSIGPWRLENTALSCGKSCYHLHFLTKKIMFCSGATENNRVPSREKAQAAYSEFPSDYRYGVKAVKAPLQAQTGTRWGKRMRHAFIQSASQRLVWVSNRNTGSENTLRSVKCTLNLKPSPNPKSEITVKPNCVVMYVKSSLNIICRAI